MNRFLFMNLHLTQIVKKFFLKILLVPVILGSHFFGHSQCTTAITSSNGYTVHIEIELTSIIAPNSCQWGYNYNVAFDYNISFSGSNIPSSLSTLQGYIACNSANTFYNLPNSGGTGTSASTGNQYNNASDCASATPESLNCSVVELQISGPGINYQTVTMNCTTLPVELLHFNAMQKADEVALDWETASEINNSHFNVEHSLDGKNWEQIGKINGTGNSSLPIDYNFNHQSPVEGISYYRLQQVDFDGKYEYLPVKSVDFTFLTESTTLVAYPNPTARNTIFLAGAAEELQDIMVFSISNQNISKQIQIQKVKDQEYKFDLTQISSGIYFIKTKSKTVKFVKL
ncbi:hypothetical protein DNU06_05840 [Putridiphycobacter roseus]|uniref:Secretion system C-terminal sorting domain-containing protein n=1 Tax=Putridiphycobacter roseus TaxID=2219161 RepID=A0A2W1N1J1_9FLAO|nr:T9SS type A sorting domain-containing protein [Putridiphycobacter roseus]PZE18137.1 hypothetical protein DNU06_05840 [Putridiphycobacter roseus]